ncbi:MAG: hypothetical protein ACREGG_02040 [Candidatus Saccharimonadales bacterium]
MYGLLKLSPHSHSGKLRPHEHTSYLPLAFLLLVVGTALVAYTVSASADTPYTGPGVGSVSLTGTVPSAPPKDGATITSPHDGQHFTSSPVTVSGTCPTDTLVEIYKNNIFAGSTPCDSSNNFSIQIDPLFGQNVLTAEVYDVLNQAGPVSQPVTIFYDYSLQGAAPTSFLDLSGSQLLLTTDAAFRGSFPNQQLNVPITVIGGTPPFAINVEWGDSTNQVVPTASDSTFNVTHAYTKPGTFKITLQGSDSKHLSVFLTVAAIINGKPDVLASTTTKTGGKGLLFLWPVFAIAATALASFWIGERREKKILIANKPVVSPFSTTAAQIAAPPKA